MSNEILEGELNETLRGFDWAAIVRVAADIMAARPVPEAVVRVGRVIGDPTFGWVNGKVVRGETSWSGPGTWITRCPYGEGPREGAWVHISQDVDDVGAWIDQLMQVDGEICVSSWERGQWFTQSRRSWAGVVVEGRCEHWMPHDSSSARASDGRRYTLHHPHENTHRDEGWLVPSKTKIKAILVPHGYEGHIPEGVPVIQTNPKTPTLWVRVDPEDGVWFQQEGWEVRRRRNGRTEFEWRFDWRERSVLDWEVLVECQRPIDFRCLRTPSSRAEILRCGKKPR